MASFFNYLTEGSRIFYTSWKARFFPKEYKGDATQICKKIVDDCWNKRYFQTSTTNFPQFWSRDFGWCVSSLMKLGYLKQVQHTLRYAMNRFKEYKKITTTITPKGKPFDFPKEAVDSLPWFIHSLRISKFPYYDHKDFLNLQIRKFFEKFINKKSGSVKKDLHVSSMKDFAIRNSSCYDNCMVGMLANDLSKMKLFNPFKKYNYSKLIKDKFWNGKYFWDDLEELDYVAGDANIFPFITGLIADKEMMKSAVKEIRAANLDQPIPLKYTSKRANVKFVWQEWLFRDYESNSVWTHVGPLYIKLVQQIDKKLADNYKEKYKHEIEKRKNYLEVFFANGEPFSSPVYYCDSGMLWAANYLTL
jgi:hypothetical protein